MKNIIILIIILFFFLPIIKKLKALNNINNQNNQNNLPPYIQDIINNPNLTPEQKHYKLWKHLSDLEKEQLINQYNNSTFRKIKNIIVSKSANPVIQTINWILDEMASLFYSSSKDFVHLTREELLSLQNIAYVPEGNIYFVCKLSIFNKNDNFNSENFTFYIKDNLLPNIEHYNTKINIKYDYAIYNSAGQKINDLTNGIIFYRIHIKLENYTLSNFDEHKAIPIYHLTTIADKIFNNLLYVYNNQKSIFSSENAIFILSGYLITINFTNLKVLDC